MRRKMVVELNDYEKDVLKGIDALLEAQRWFNCGGEEQFREFASGFDKESPYSLAASLIKKSMHQFLFISTDVYNDEVLNALVEKWYDECLDNGESATYNLTSNADRIWS